MTGDTPTQRAHAKLHNRQIVRRRRLIGRALPTLIVLIVVVIALGHVLFGGSKPTAKAAATDHKTNVAVTGPPKAPPSSNAGTSSGSAPTGLTATVKTGLTKTLAHYVAGRTGDAAVAVLDLKTGATYCFHCERRFVTASIVKVDILETLLLHAQHSHTTLNADQQALAVRMIENSDNDAASDLYNEDGANTGIDAANIPLGLTHTTVGADGVWGDTETTVTDQLVLMHNIISTTSPLSAASRHYIKSLMSNVESDQRWGVPAAAGGRSYLVKNGWLPRTLPPPNWTVNSDGVLLAGHHDDPLAVSTLTALDPTMPYGIITVQHMAKLVVAPLTWKRSGA